MRFIPTVFAAARREFGESVQLLHDVHHRLSPNEAARVGQDLEPYRLFWMEDPTPAENQESFRLIRQHTTTPLAVGEIFNSVWDSRSLIEEQLIDYIRSAICHAGGITHMRTIAALAGLHQVRTGFHGATDLSPVTFGAAVHFDIWVPNFGIQEHMPHEAATMEVFSHDHRFEDGYLIVSDAPGHGVDIDEEAAARYDYQPAYLPVNRLTDGTLWDW
jgi:mannonate dehydratase